MARGSPQRPSVPILAFSNSGRTSAPPRLESLISFASGGFFIAIAAHNLQLAAIGSSDGTVSGRMRFLSLHKLERPDVGRAANKLCTLGNDWLRGMQVSAVDPIF